MKKLLFIILSLLTVFSFSSCQAKTEAVVKLNEVKKEQISRGEANIILNELKENETINDISLIFSKLSGDLILKDKNDVISPLSLYMAFAELYEVGDDNVKKEIKEFLNLDENLLSHTKDIMLLLDNKIENYILTNSIWLEKSVKTKQEGLDNLANKLLTEAYYADFKNNNKKANEEISKYVYDNTKGLIDHKFNLSTEVIFTLLNTIYLKSNWSKELGTKELEFNGLNNKKKTEFLVGTKHSGRIGETESSRFNYVTTKDGLRFTLFIPKDGYILNDIMNYNNINEINNYKYAYTDEENNSYTSSVIFPSYNVKSSRSLMDYLKTNNYLKQTRASFNTNISSDTVCVSDVIHDANFTVDKNGIEAAAMTAIVVETTAAIGGRDIHEELVIDKSFGFILSYDNIILFSGLVADI